MKSEHSDDVQEHGISEDRTSHIAKTNHVQENDGIIEKYENLTKSALMEEAKKSGIVGRNMMDKRQLIKALRSIKS